MNSQDPELVAGRSCGPCSLCCKVSRVATLEKPAGKWCPHCAPGRGACMIHDVRPSECRNFHCSWLLSPELGPEWRPLTCKMVLIRRPHQILLLVDPGHPSAWREEPYDKVLKEPGGSGSFRASVAQREPPPDCAMCGNNLNCCQRHNMQYLLASPPGAGFDPHRIVVDSFPAGKSASAGQRRRNSPCRSRESHAAECDRCCPRRV